MTGRRSDDSLPLGCVGRCAECGMPLRAWNEPHTFADCEWWKDTQPLRDALVGIGRMQEDLCATATVTITEEEILRQIASRQ